MSEPSPKRLKAGEGDVAALQVGEQEAAAGNGPADNIGGLEGGTDADEAERLAAELDECQKALDKVNDEASDRVLAVEREYNKKRRPIYDQRSAIIRKLPLFWQRTLASHPVLADQLSDDDTAILEYLTELDVIDFDDIKSGFKIVLMFSAANPYFSNPTLTKVFQYSDDGKPMIQPAVIDWKEGHGNSQEFGPSYAFFAWLTSSQPWPEGGVSDEIAEVIKDEIWPNPVKYYYSEVALAGQEYDEMEDEGAVLEGVLPGAEGDIDEGEEVVYDEGEEELAGGEGEGGDDGFGDDGGEA